MLIRKANEFDLDRIEEIFKDAKVSLKKDHVDQWQKDAYPSVENARNDLKHGDLYVVEKDGVVCATALIACMHEPTYDVIEQGMWKTNGKYFVIHRMAVDSRFKGSGVSVYLVDCAKDMALRQGVHAIRIDTHPDNLRMQGFLKKCGFKKCGIIYLEDHDIRYGFELVF